MFSRICAVAPTRAKWVPILSLLVFGFTQFAHADTTYYYQGAALTDSGIFSCVGGIGECALSGQFTVAAPLGDSLSYGLIVPSSYSFTDGVYTYSSTNPSVYNTEIYLSTDASGDIETWSVTIDATTFVPGGRINNTLTSSYQPALYGGGEDRSTAVTTFVDPDNGAGSALSTNNDTPQVTPQGVWGLEPPSLPPVPTPEPRTSLLLGTGLLSLMGIGLRRKIA